MVDEKVVYNEKNLNRVLNNTKIENAYLARCLLEHACAAQSFHDSIIQ